MTIEIHPFKDVFPIKHHDFPLPMLFFGLVTGMAETHHQSQGGDCFLAKELDASKNYLNAAALKMLLTVLKVSWLPSKTARTQYGGPKMGFAKPLRGSCF